MCDKLSDMIIWMCVVWRIENGQRRNEEWNLSKVWVWYVFVVVKVIVEQTNFSTAIRPVPVPTLPKLNLLFQGEAAIW